MTRKKKQERTPDHSSLSLNRKGSASIFWIIESLHVSFYLKAHEDALEEPSDGRKRSCLEISQKSHNS